MAKKRTVRKKLTGEQYEELTGLVSIWKNFTEKYVSSENYIYEWQNFLDARRLIDNVTELLSYAEQEAIKLQLKPLDEKVIANTFEIKECVWGNKVENENGYNRTKHWYYYRVNQHVFNSESGKFTRL